MLGLLKLSKNEPKSLIEKIKGDGRRPIIRQSTRRFVLQPGFACNLRCSFCYYRDSVMKGITKDYSTEEVKAKLREAKSLGLDQVDISGGEPTLRSDLQEIIRYARDIGFIKVCLITNGIRIADKAYADSLVEAGLNEILFSTHGTNKEEHDKLTNVKGSFDNIWKAVENIYKRKEVKLRFNSTITNFNYKSCNKLFEMLKPYKPYDVNILVFNPSQEACKTKEEKVRFANYNEICSEISKAIDKYKKDFNIINVRWIPYCILKGHEEHVRTMWQKLYEDNEWDPYLNIKYNKGSLAVAASFFAGLFLYPFKAPRYGRRNLYTKFNEILSTFRQVYYYKHLRACRRCSLRKICPGLPKDYVEKYNKTVLTPYKLGKVIKDPLYYCRKYHEKFTSLRL